MFASLKLKVGRLDASVSANDLLKKATAPHDAGDLDGAITLLRQAYAEIARGPVSYSVEILKLMDTDIDNLEEKWKL